MELQRQDDTLYNSTCNISAFSSDTPGASQKARSKIGQLCGGPAPIESTPIVNQRLKELFHVQTGSGSIQSLSRNRPHAITYSPHVRITGFCERGFCITPSWRRASRNPAKDRRPTIGFPHAVPGRYISPYGTLFRSKPRRVRLAATGFDWQWFAFGQEPGE